MANGQEQHDPITQMAADPDFAKLSLAQQRQALAAHDAAFSDLNDDQLTRFVKSHQTTLSPEDYAAQQAHNQIVGGMKVMTSSPEAPSQFVNGELRPGAQSVGLQESAFTESGQRKEALGANYNDYMKQSGAFAGTTAGTMATGGLSQGSGVLRLAGRALSTGAGAGTGALAGGASPSEAAATSVQAMALQPVAEGVTAGVSALAKKALGPKTVSAVPIQDEWRAINDALGVKANAIRIGENASDLSQAATMPGRALAKAGLTSEQLSKMTPLEQQAAIQPIRARAAAELDDAFKAATDSGKTFDVGKTATDVIKRIANPKAGVDLQQQAVDAFTHVAEEAGISNQRATTAEQARSLRQLLAPGARFGPSGDLSSLSGIRAELYRAVNRDLRASFPELKDPDMFYSDVKAASTAARNGVAKMATKASAEAPPTFMEKTLDTAKAEAIPFAIKAAIGTGLYGVGKKLYDYATASNP